MALNRQQLAKILELMGSAHDGEALAAARRAHMLVRNSGETWESLLDQRPAALRQPAPAASPTPERPRTGHGRELTSYEMLYALLHSNRTPTLIKKRLKPLESRIVDGDVADDVLQELRLLFRRYVAVSAGA